LHLAASCGYKEVVEVLLRSNLFSCDELNMNDQYPLHLASIKGHEEVVKLLLNEHSTANKQNGEGYTALQLAAMRGHEGVVRQLVETQQTHNSNRKPPPLHLAAKAGHGGIVRLLAQLNKEDVNATFGEEGTPLHCAVISQKPEVVETLIGLHVDLDKKRFSGWGALHLACREKLTTIIKQLIDAGANINLPTSNGSPPLSVAAQEGHFEGVQLLLDAGADPNQCNIRGVGPLYRAIFCRSVECVDALLNAGADPFKEASYISTPYKLALDLEGDIANSLKRHTQGLLASKASSGDVSGLRRLLDYEVDINGQDECGRTALFWASACGHREIIKVLHKYKAKHTIQDKDDLTCFDTATSDPMTLDLLRDLFLGLSKDTLLEDGGEYNCNYHERQGYRISSLRCNICREGRMNGYFFRKYLLYSLIYNCYTIIC
ncbi:ankyrin repeat-containing domain protein, partial [Tuber indicum]